MIFHYYKFLNINNNEAKSRRSQGQTIGYIPIEYELSRP